MSIQWKRGLQRFYFLAAAIWVLAAGSLTYWQVHSEKVSICDEVKQAETVKHNAALHKALVSDVVALSKAADADCVKTMGQGWVAVGVAKEFPHGTSCRREIAPPPGSIVPIPEGATGPGVPTPSMIDAFDEVAEAAKEGVSVRVLDSLDLNRKICDSETPMKSSLEVAFIPVFMGYGLFLAGCWVASGFKSS